MERSYLLISLNKLSGPGLKGRLKESICPALMSMQKLFAIFVALAVLFAPAFTRAGEAFAAVSDHHVQMMPARHCDMPSSDSGDRDEVPAQNCCISMCMAVAIAPPVPPIHEELRGPPAVFPVAMFRLGLPPEIATPPPRSA